ncbi:hypothetical protein Acr_27g0000360 [Actinidia rufa]|uniref:Uncharacterized protein n=1 Tax=Actinidia rufa TaxID=165716 RepID=A0A7J0H5B6_9ERIC|nr:hypothetical protein Acr_27g0000360 [Actinidia rufa]
MLLAMKQQRESMRVARFLSAQPSSSMVLVPISLEPRSSFLSVRCLVVFIRPLSLTTTPSPAERSALAASIGPYRPPRSGFALGGCGGSDYSHASRSFGHGDRDSSGSGHGRGRDPRRCTHYNQKNHTSSLATITLAQTGVSTTCVATHIPWVIDSGVGTLLRFSQVFLSLVVFLMSLLSMDSPLRLMVWTGKKICGGSKHSGLYYFDANVSPLALRSIVDPCQLDCRLGHLSLLNLKKLVPIAQSLPCEVYSTSVLFSDRPLYTLPPHVFGCTCYVQALDLGCEKTDPRAIKDPERNISTRVPSMPPASFVSRSPVKLLQVYVRCNKMTTAQVPVLPPSAPSSDSLYVFVSPVAHDIGSFPIALRKGKRTCTLHPISQFISCDHLSPSLCAFTISLTIVPKSVSKAMSVPSWTQAMVEEMTALHDNGTWEMVPFSSRKSIVCCRCMFTMKYLPDGTVEHYKARLDAEGYTQTCVIDYTETFSTRNQNWAECTKYKAMTHTSCDLMWVKHFLEELRFEVQLPMDMYCDNQVIVHIASNPVFHERTKHIKVDYHLIREHVEEGIIASFCIHWSTPC